jgi:pimeloyl-ACP methyl ester carboxylesterase
VPDPTEPPAGTAPPAGTGPSDATGPPAGRGPPAVWFLSGNMLDPAVIFAQVAAPPGYRRVLRDWLAGPAPTDLPAAAARLAAELAQARPRPLILVGHSAGAVLAMLVTLRVPEHVHGLLVANSGAHTAGQRNSDMPGRVAASFGPDLAAEFIDRCHARPLRPGARDALIRYALRGDPARYLDAFTSIRRIDLRPELSRITCPVTVVHGLRDQVRRPGHAQELAAGIRDSELIASDSGHSSPLEDPVTVQRALAGLAARVAAADHPRP